MEKKDQKADMEIQTVASKEIKSFIFNPETKKLQVLDQTLLPGTLEYIAVNDSVEGHSVITKMMVRGAPCIAAVGCLSVVAEINQPHMIHDAELSKDSLIESLKVRSSYLGKSRPTAVNLSKALKRLVNYAESVKDDATNIFELVDKITEYCVKAIQVGANLNKKLGDFGAETLLLGKNKNDGITVLTHCNTGALATVGYGTALGVVRSLRNKGVLKHVYCTETRPYNQGSRLTAFELAQEKMPATLIADSMVAYLMESEHIDAVVVGADAVAANGDTANKIGTLQIAILAKHYKIPFYVACPSQTFSFGTKNQSGFVIEKRPADELRIIGNCRMAPDDIEVLNPGFDITPGVYIKGLITEFGVYTPDNLHEVQKLIEECIDTESGLF